MKTDKEDFDNLGNLYVETTFGKNLDSQDILEEGFMDRMKARVGGATDFAKDLGSNIKSAVKGATDIASGGKTKEAGKYVGDTYRNRKADIIYKSHMNRIQTALSNFATDMVKLGLMSEQEAESMANTSFTALKNVKALSKYRNLHDVE